MKISILTALLLFPILHTMASPFAAENVVFAVHGGTGVPQSELTKDKEAAIRAALTEALKQGYAKLQHPAGSGLDAVEAAIVSLEDSPLFNAGKGAVFTRDGRNELDASMMEGATKRAGAVAGVTTIKNPIRAARAVMEKSSHVLLIGKGADHFAKEMDLEIVLPRYFHTPERWQQHLKALEKERKDPEKKGVSLDADPDHQWGTVGAVARDKAGNLYAGTSTGGMTNKRFGRVGDSPIIGAGTYADDAVAVSGTGHGEYFIRLAVAHEIAAQVKHKQISISAAADGVIRGQLKKLGGEGGVIALDRNGKLAMPYESDGLYRGYVTSDGNTQVLLYDR